MKLVFVSNYINHHQFPISDELSSFSDVDYTFIQTEKMEEERIKMGWDSTDRRDYVLYYYDNPQRADKLIDAADIVIFGGTDDESYIEKRLEDKKIVIRYSERVYKEGRYKWISPRGLVKKYHDHTRHNKEAVYLLCAGGYVADDFNLFYAYPGKRYRWGYFPKTYEYSATELNDKRRDNKRLNLLWAGRMIDWKHPEVSIEVARALKEGGIDYTFNIIGDGERYEAVKQLIDEYKLNENVVLIGAKSPAEVREYMRSADIFLFTSDYKEGWGAVLNEAMNSGCAVVASHAIGAVPFMISDMQNGRIYKNGDIRMCNRIVLELAHDRKKREELGNNAYLSTATLWNEHVAAKRLVEFCSFLLYNTEMTKYEAGPLSEAPVIKEYNMAKVIISNEDKCDNPGL